MKLSNGTASIEIALEKERIKTMPVEEKLNMLVDIAFATHEELSKQGKILYGTNGTQGMCEIVRAVKRSTAWLWSIFCIVSGAYFTILTLHIVRP